MANALRCVSPYYYILIRETHDPKMDHQLEILQQEFIRKTAGHSQILPETLNETKITELMDHVREGFIGRKQLLPGFIQSSCRNANVVIYLQRNDNPGMIPELVKTLGFMTAKVRDNNTLELELIATSFIYKGCGSTMMNTFLHSAKDAGFENLYLYSLLSPFEFYQGMGFTYMGHTKEDRVTNAKQKNYMMINLQKNDIRNFDIRKIKFQPPRPGTEMRVPTHKELMQFMDPSKPYPNIQPEHLKELGLMSQFRKTNKHGKKYLNANTYSSFLNHLSRKRNRSRQAEESSRGSPRESPRESSRETSRGSPRGVKRFKHVVRKVMNKIKSQKKKKY